MLGKEGVNQNVTPGPSLLYCICHRATDYIETHSPEDAMQVLCDSACNLILISNLLCGILLEVMY